MNEASKREMSGIKIIKRVKSSNIPYKGKARYDSSLPANKHDPEQGEKGAESSRRRVQHKGYKHASIVGDSERNSPANTQLIYG